VKYNDFNIDMIFITASIQGEILSSKTSYAKEKRRKKKKKEEDFEKNLD